MIAVLWHVRVVVLAALGARQALAGLKTGHAVTACAAARLGPAPASWLRFAAPTTPPRFSTTVPPPGDGSGPCSSLRPPSPGLPASGPRRDVRPANALREGDCASIACNCALPRTGTSATRAVSHRSPTGE